MIGAKWGRGGRNREAKEKFKHNFPYKTWAGKTSNTKSIENFPFFTNEINYIKECYALIDGLSMFCTHFFSLSKEIYLILRRDERKSSGNVWSFFLSWVNFLNRSRECVLIGSHGAKISLWLTGRKKKKISENWGEIEITDGKGYFSFAVTAQLNENPFNGSSSFACC